MDFTSDVDDDNGHDDGSSETSSIIDVSLLAYNPPLTNKTDSVAGSDDGDQPEGSDEEKDSTKKASTPLATTARSVALPSPYDKEERIPPSSEEQKQREEDKDDDEGEKEQEKRDEIKIIVGESIQRWRRLNQQNDTDTKTKNWNPDGPDKNASRKTNNKTKKNEIFQPDHILLHHPHSDMDQSDWEGCNLKPVSEKAGGTKGKSTNKQELQKVEFTNRQLNLQYIATLQEQTSSELQGTTVLEPSSLVNCIAIWNPSKNAYVLEIANLYSTSSEAETPRRKNRESPVATDNGNSQQQQEQQEQQEQQKQKSPNDEKKPESNRLKRPTSLRTRNLYKRRKL